MLTINGWIKSSTSTRFVADFVIDGHAYTFAGNLSISVQPFSATNATLEYASVDQLSGTCQYEGQIGKSGIKLTFANGPTIAGGLDMPINPANTVTGSGYWTLGPAGGEPHHCETRTRYRDFACTHQLLAASLTMSNGWIKSDSSKNLVANFTVGDLAYNFSGVLVGEMQQFTVTKATLQYTDVGQLTSTRTYKGEIGKTALKLTFDSGLTITGQLDLPIHSVSRVTGSGFWVQN